MYQVQQIKGKKKIRGVVHYLIKWLGYSVQQQTWQPIKNLQAIKHMIQDYEQRIAKKKYQGKKIKKNLSEESDQESDQRQYQPELGKKRTKGIHKTKYVKSKQSSKNDEIEQNIENSHEEPPENDEIISLNKSISEKNEKQSKQELNEKLPEQSEQKSQAKKSIKLKLTKPPSNNPPFKIIGMDKVNQKFIFWTQLKNKQKVWISHEYLLDFYPRELARFYESKIELI